MRFLSTLVILPTLFLPVLSCQADEPEPGQAPQLSQLPGTGDLTEATPKARLDSLFSRLKREGDAERAKAIAGEIRSALTESGSATVDLLMSRAADAIAANRTPAAFDFLDQVIVLKPDYTEGWNLRATLHFALGNHRKSVSDIGHVLALEPRHLGALSGLAGIMTLDGRDESALKVWESYLSLYPADRSAQDQARDLLEKIAGSRT